MSSSLVVAGATTEKAKEIVQSWQGTHEALSAKHGALPNIKEPPNALALVLNLQHIEVKAALETLQGATPEESKAHKALRTSFIIVKMMYPGFTFIDNDNHDKDAKSGSYGNKKGGAASKATSNHGSGGAKEKLGHFDDGGSVHVLLHTYKIESKKNVGYRASKRLDECVAISPGMIVNAAIWGDKIQSTFNMQKEDILPFQFGLIQLKIKSISANNAADAGRLLEIKNFTSLDMQLYNPSSFKLLRADGLLPSSKQEATLIRERILDGTLISEQNRQHVNQSLIQGSVSTSVQLLCVTPQSGQGAISLAADGKIKFFMQQPIGDLSAYAINLEFDRMAHHCPVDGCNDEWMVKVFNVALMMSAVQIMVVVDSYKTKDLTDAEVVYDGFIRIDLAVILKHIIACKEGGVSLTSALELNLERAKTIASVFETQGMSSAIKNFHLFPSVVEQLDLVIDVRKMSNKREGQVIEDHTSAFVHHDGKWKKGYMLYVFFEGKFVLSGVIPLVDLGGMFASGSAKRTLDSSSSVQFADLIKDIDFEEEAPLEPPPNTEEESAETIIMSSSTSSLSGPQEDATNKPPAKKKAKSHGSQQ